jgi:Ca-activated chloride channel family protein
MDELRIDNVNQLKWLLIVAACGIVLLYGFARKKQALAAFTSDRLLGVLIPDLSFVRQYVKAGLVLVAMTAIVLAMIGPRWGTYFEDAVRRQLDLMVCLDVSRSMLAEDAGMSRLDRAKDDVKRLLDKLGGGSIGLVAFAGKAELVCPLTDDYEFYRLALEDVGPHVSQLGGTNLGEAIKVAAKGLGGPTRQQRAIILITDGEDTADSQPVEEAKKARRDGISVYCIGVGDSKRGGLIPIQKGGERNYVMQDGEQVWSKLDPEELQSIAQAGGGEYQPSGQVTANQRTLEWLYAEKLMPREAHSTKERRVPRQYARFAWPAALALALLIVESLIRERRAPA